MDIHVASTEADHEAVEKIRAHHAELEGALAVRVATLHAAVRAGGDVGPARDEVVAWADAELLPHAAAEEETVYAAAAARPEGRLLVEGLVADHRTIGDLVRGLDTAADGVAAASAASALAVLVGSHVEKENDQVLPLLAAEPGVSLAALLEGMHHELVGHEAEEAAEGGGGCGGHCTCGEQDAAGDVELDARTIDHAIRHATIFGALDGLAAGRALVLVAPHDPVPLLAQLEQRSPGAFEVSYLDRGPEAWRVRLLRRAA
jgi:uncharacterized protein (DUF2249 family)